MASQRPPQGAGTGLAVLLSDHTYVFLLSSKEHGVAQFEKSQKRFFLWGDVRLALRGSLPISCGQPTGGPHQPEDTLLPPQCL